MRMTGSTFLVAVAEVKGHGARYSLPLEVRDGLMGRPPQYFQTELGMNEPGSEDSSSALNGDSQGATPAPRPQHDSLRP